MEPEEQLLFIHLSRFCYDSKNTAFPSQSTLAELTGLAERTVRKYIGTMVEKKIISITNRHTNGKPKLNTYKLIDWYGVDKIADKPTGKPRLIKNDEANNVSSSGKLCLSNRQTVSDDEAQFAYEEYEGRKGIKNMNEENELAAEPRGVGASESSDGNNFFEEFIIPPPAPGLNFSHKPKALLPRITDEKKLKEKIYFYFRSNIDPESYKYRTHLDKAQNLKELTEAYHYLPYWDRCSVKTLADFLSKTSAFIEEAEASHLFDTLNYSRDNREAFVRQFIKENNLYDVTGIKDAKKHFSGIKLTRLQKLYVNSRRTLFVHEFPDGSKHLRTHMDEGERCLTGGEFFADLSELTVEAFKERMCTYA